jgi:hypothetical protein
MRRGGHGRTARSACRRSPSGPSVASSHPGIAWEAAERSDVTSPRLRSVRGARPQRGPSARRRTG